MPFAISIPTGYIYEYQTISVVNDAERWLPLSLLRSKHERAPLRRGLPEFRTKQCVAYERGHGITWCRFICTPIGDRGDCGRLAPHSIVGKTQAAIAAYKSADSEE